jgi:hypothetical protein
MEKRNKASTKEQIESKHGKKYESWNKKRNKANAKEQIVSKSGTKL